MASPSPFLEQEEYANEYWQAQKQARLFWLPFNEFERLAANKLRGDLPPNIPKVNDGSLAFMMQQTPMRILGQGFNGNVKVTESVDPATGQPTYPQPWLKELANTVWSKEIVPNANTQAPFHQKMVLSLYDSLIYGGQPIFTFFTKRGSYRGADFTLPYVRDVYLEVGKKSDLDCDYIFMDTYYTRLQIAKLIAAVKEQKKNKVKPSWDVDALQKIYDSHQESVKDYLAKGQAERNRPVMATYIKFTTVFQRGVNAPFDTFYGTGERNNVTIVRTLTNPDPTGDIPIHYLYAYETLDNPYGRGQAEILGGTQNVLDYLVQLHVLANQIGLQPPILVQGDKSMTNLDSMIYSPSQFWFTGAAQVDVMETSSSILKEFPQAYGLYKNQLMNGQGTDNVDVSAESAGPTRGKTPQAIAHNESLTNAHDNFLRNQVVDTYNKVFKSMLNIHFSNMQGEDILRLEAADAVRLSRAGLIPTDAKGNPETNEVALVWDNLRGHFDFEIDPDSSSVKDNQAQVTALTEVLNLIQENPYLLQYIRSTGYSLNLGEVYAEIFTKLGLQDSEKILEPMSDQDKAEAQAVPPMVFDKPHIELPFDNMPAQAQLQILQRLGLNVTLLDVLMGPPLNPNFRGAYENAQIPGVELPRPDEQVLSQEAGGQPVPPPSEEKMVQLPHGATYVPNPNLSPDTNNLIQQVMAEKQVPQNLATGIVHARGYGIPDAEIDKWLQNNVGAANGRQ